MEGIKFEFFLDFGVDSFGLIQITEPFKFDGASFTVEQDKGRYGRDVSFGNEEVLLSFQAGIFEKSAVQYQLPNGTTIDYFTMGLPYLLEQDKLTGFESEVKFILKKDGVAFTVGLLDFQMRKTDGLTYFECKIIQETQRTIIKRRFDTKCDVFSDKNMDLQPITPLVPVSILLKAKPVVQISEWQSHPRLSLAGEGTYVNTAQSLVKYGVKKSFIPFFEAQSFGLEGAVNNFRIIEAEEELINVTIKIDSDIEFIYRVTGGSGSSSAKIGLYYYVYPYPFEDSPWNAEEVLVYEKKITGTSSQNFVLPASFDFITIPVPKGYSFSLFWAMNWDTEHLGSGEQRTRWDFRKFDVNITATSTAIDSVIKGVRYIDAIKQNVKSINGFPVISDKFDVGGEFYDQFVFNGYGIRQFTDKPFYVNLKELCEGLAEVNADYQVNPTNFYINQYADFYPNKDLGGFISVPFEEFQEDYSERATLVNIEMKYKHFELDREESNTVDGVHTEAQWLFPNKQVENVKKIEIPQIRDPFAIESARRQGISTKDTTSLDGDDKVYLLDVVELAPNTRKILTSNLNFITDGVGGLKLLSDGSFNWKLLGFSVGDVLIVTETSGTNNYSVVTIDSASLSLSGVGFVPTGSGFVKFKIDYPITTALYTNRTNEGFTLIENIASGDNFSNLKYTTRRNLNHWESFIKMGAKFKPNGVISNTFFKNNGLARTQFMGGQIYQENENINVSDLTPAILSPRTYKTKVVAEFDVMTKLLEGLNTVNADGTIGGFIRISDTINRVVKIHPTKLDYEWSTGILTVTGESRQESDYVEIDTVGIGLIQINEVGYDSIILANENYTIYGNYVTLFDINSVPLINTTHFSLFKVNGVVFTNTIDLANALSAL
jgi:hypothetical protein